MGRKREGSEREEEILERHRRGLTDAEGDGDAEREH